MPAPAKTRRPASEWRARDIGERGGTRKGFNLKIRIITRQESPAAAHQRGGPLSLFSGERRNFSKAGGKGAKSKEGMEVWKTCLIHQRQLSQLAAEAPAMGSEQIGESKRLIVKTKKKSRRRQTLMKGGGDSSGVEKRRNMV